VSAADKALPTSGLNREQQNAVRVQVNLIQIISMIDRPDWAHVQALIHRLNFLLGDRAPAISSALGSWSNSFMHKREARSQNHSKSPQLAR